MAGIVIRTLGDYVRHGYALAAWCRGCSRVDWLDLKVLIARLGADDAPSESGGRMPLRCVRCGSRNVGVTMHSPGMAASRREEGGR